MRIRDIGVSGGVMAIVIVITMPLWYYRPRLLGVYHDVDINGGDVRRRVFFLGLRVNKRIAGSPFSQEIQRLGISTPDECVWKPRYARALGKSFMYKYNGAIENCNFLVQMLEVSDASDEERARILEQALTRLRAGELSRIYDLVDAVADRLGAIYGLPPAPKDSNRPPRDWIM